MYTKCCLESNKVNGYVDDLVMESDDKMELKDIKSTNFG
jgi:hypothetical protein